MRDARNAGSARDYPIGFVSHYPQEVKVALMRFRDAIVVFSQRLAVVGAGLALMVLALVVFSQPLPPERFRDRTALWQRSGKNILSGFRNMYNFHVLYEPGAEYPFRAWFFGWAVEDCNANVPGFKGCDAIFAARARQLEGPWEVYAGDGKWDATGNPRLWRPLFAPLGTYFDEWHNGDPSVVKVGKRYYMAYSATGHDKDRKPDGTRSDTDGSYLCIMGAVSGDGIYWKRSEKPILAYPREYVRKAIEGDVVVYGSYHRPSILYESGVFKMWFDYWTPRGVAMGYAENRGDFLNPDDWQVIRAGKQPCLWEFPNPDVVKVGKLYYAYADPGGYANHPWIGRKIVEAVSRDGLDWQVLGYIEPDADASAIHVPEALVLSEKGATRIYLFYACQIGGEPEYNYRYNRIRYMWRVVSSEEPP